MQTQGYVASDGIARHQVQIGEVSDQLQYGTNVDILKVEREFLARISKTLSLALLGFILGQRLDADGQFVVCLVRQIIVSTGRLDGDTSSTSLSGRIDKFHGRSEILNIKTNTQRLWQLSLVEEDTNLSALLLNGRAYRWVRERNNDVPGTVFTPTEIDILDRLTYSHRLGRRSHWSNGRS